MTCKICGWLCAWLCSDTDAALAIINKKSRAWESAHSNEYELWSRISDQQRELLDTAKAVRSTDPDAAFRIYRDMADEGVVWAMEVVGYCYQNGLGTQIPPDFELARTYYERAIEAGSWMATLKYAWLLENRGQFDLSEQLLRQGVEAGFVPACYWLARCRLKQSPDRETCREIRPLLERAADAGHPGAVLTLAQLKLGRKFGLREIPQGVREILKVVDWSSVEAPSSNSGQIPAAVA